MAQSRSVFILSVLAATLLGGAPGLNVVVLDPGHGGTNLGAPDRFGPSGRYEKHHSLKIAQQVAAHLEAAGVTVKLTRTRDKTMSLKRRINFANTQHADVFVSIHLNATDVPGPTGHETFFLALEATDEAARRLARFENDGADAVGYAAEAAPQAGAVADILLDLTRNRAHGDAERLAAAIQNRLIPQSPFKNRGVKQAPFFVLMGAAMPAVVVEVGFINHYKEGPYITSAAGQERLARGIADGILDFGQLVLAPRVQREPTPPQKGTP